MKAFAVIQRTISYSSPKGTCTVLDAPEGESADIFAWVHSFRDFGPKYIGEGFNEKVTLPTTGGDGLKLELDKEINKYVKD
ncbi:hypothetical protein K0H71_22160 [Bacillus sp. IITD106]|nr:hypothetical protein [Bacillus sp. IITD106]